MTIKSALCKKHGYSVPSTQSGGRCQCPAGACPFDMPDRKVVGDDLVPVFQGDAA